MAPVAAQNNGRGISKIKSEEGETKRGDTMKERLKAGYEIATGALALFAVSLAVLDMTRGLNQWQRIADNIVLAVFIIDYIVRLFVSSNKRDFVKHNIFDLIAIIPFSSFFRAFRIARLARLAKITKISKVSRLAAYSLRLVNRAKVFFDTNGFKYVLALSCVLVAVGGVLIHFAEGMGAVRRSLVGFRHHNNGRLWRYFAQHRSWARNRYCFNDYWHWFIRYFDKHDHLIFS